MDDRLKPAAPPQLSAGSGALSPPTHAVRGGKQYLVMVCGEGEDLAQRLEQAGRLAEPAVLQWTAQICSALEYMHSRHPPVIHRDVKPANIKTTPPGEAVLVDFGIAKALAAGQATSTGAKGVTPGFAPPEQYDLGQTDPRSDVYALGRTLHLPPEAKDEIAEPGKVARRARSLILREWLHELGGRLRARLPSALAALGGLSVLAEMFVGPVSLVGGAR